MPIESVPEIEKISKAKTELLNLEKTGKYVFHGSISAFESLEPRQPTQDNLQTGQREQHGEAAICASPYVDVAIFSALIKANASNIKEPSDCVFSLSGRKFRATPNLLEQAKGIIGKVYVLDKKDFYLFGGEGYEWRSDKKIAPIKVIEVTVGDLPKNIKVIEE